MHCEFNLLVVCKKKCIDMYVVFLSKIGIFYTTYYFDLSTFFEKQKGITSFSLKYFCFSELPSYIVLVYVVNFFISYLVLYDKKKLILLFLETTSQ